MKTRKSTDAAKNAAWKQAEMSAEMVCGTGWAAISFVSLQPADLQQPSR